MLKNTQRDEKGVAWSLRDEDVDSCSDDSGDEVYIDRFHDPAYFAMLDDDCKDSDMSDGAAALVTMMGSVSLEDPKKLSTELIGKANIKRPEPRKTQSTILFNPVFSLTKIRHSNGATTPQGPRVTVGNESMFKVLKTRRGAFASLSQPASTRHGNGATTPQGPMATIGNEGMFKAPEAKSRVFASLSQPALTRQSNGAAAPQWPRATIGNESMFKAPKTRSGSFASLSQPASTIHGNGGAAPQWPRATIGNESMFKAPEAKSRAFASLSQPALTIHGNGATAPQRPMATVGNKSMVKAPNIKKNKRSNSLKQKNSASISQRSRLKVGKAFSFGTFETENTETNVVRPVKRYLRKSEADDVVTKKIRLG